MKNKGFLNRSRIGNSVAHKEAASSLNPAAENTAPIVAPLPASSNGTYPGIAPVPKTAGARSKGARRYTLNLHVPGSAAEKLARYLGQFPPSRRAAARRALVSAFMADVQKGTYSQGGTALGNLVRLRVDLRMTDHMRDAFLAKANAGSFEPKASALARYLAPLLAGFISTHLDLRPTLNRSAAMPNTEALP